MTAEDDAQAALDAVLDDVAERVTPGPEERDRLRRVADELAARARDAVADLSVDADVVQVGSTARGTWLAGDRDVDLFVRFPTDLDRETLERYGLQVGYAVLPDGHEEYAEHPYVKGTSEGFEVDCVPCYDVDGATDIRSAVDRTPFHDAYLQRRLDDALAGDVLLAKRFLKGVGVYGSNLRTQGFSGYLTELLVVDHGGFVPLLEAATDWHPPVVIDPRDGTGGPAEVPPDVQEAATFDDSLVVVDPTDPDRNVAAVLSESNLARFQHYARDLLAAPREELFFPPETVPLSAAELREHLERRETTPLAVVFDAPDVVDDQLYPQLYRSLSGVRSALDRRGFDVVRATTFADDRAVLLVEPGVDRRPAIERHDGPPVHVREHATGFYETYAADPTVYGPFVEDGRYVVERVREYRTPTAFLRRDALFDVALGAHVETALEDDYAVLVGDELTDLVDEFGVQLRRYFEPRV